MVACKILLICLAVVAMNARSSQSQYVEDLKDCACFKRDKGTVRISNLADKHGKHERTVVYIFKHPDTRKVTFYVPSEEKQIQFPDLTVSNLESYTDYKIENLNQINNPKIPLMDPSILTHIIGLQIPDVHKHHKVINHIHPHIINIKPDIKPNNKGGKPVSPDLIDIEVGLQVNGHKKIDGKNPPPQLQKPLTDKHKPLINVIEPVNIISGPKKHVHITNDLIHQNPLSQVDVPDYIHIEMGQTNPETINGQETKIPSKINIKQVTDKVNQSLSPIVVTKPSRGSITITDNVIQETDINSIKKVEEMLNFNNDNVMPSSVSLKQVNNPVFSRWLIEEISNVGTATYDTVEIHRIKIRLLLVLEQSGLRFSETGDLIDMNGRVFKISNLKLRRVMISDPVVYKKLEGECVPHGIPYLEAVFVSLVSPPTVLGVIPLKMTSLPRCKKGKCRKCAARKNNHFLVGPRLPQKLNLTPMHSATMGLIPRMSSNSKNEEVLPTRGHNGLNKNDYVIISSNGHTGVNENENVVLSSNGHTGVNENENVVLSSNGHTGVNENENVVLSSNGHTGVNENENVLPTRVRTGIHDGHDRQDDVNTIHDHDIDDELGIRIIGGSSATSSGTPVSSKGRSRITEVSSSAY